MEEGCVCLGRVPQATMELPLWGVPAVSREHTHPRMGGGIIKRETVVAAEVAKSGWLPYAIRSRGCAVALKWLFHKRVFGVLVSSAETFGVRSLETAFFDGRARPAMRGGVPEHLRSRTRTP